MSQRTRTAAVCGVLVLIFVVLGTLANAADLRTTSRGRPIVRQATYQESIVTPQPEMSLEPAFPQPEAANCVDPCWDRCAPCCPTPCAPSWCWWGSFEFLLWWQSGRDVPPLVTTGSSQTAVNMVGSLGLPDTEVLYGGEALGQDVRPGARLTIGAWMDACRMIGVGCRIYSIGESEESYDIDSTMVPILARPFTNITLGREDADVVTYPGSTVGGISVQSSSDVAGGDIFFRKLFFQDACRRVDLLAGYQFARIDQDLMIASTRTSVATGGSIPFGTVVENSDTFATNNTYNAGVVGFISEYDRGCVTWTLIAKVGLGKMKQQTTIAGGTTRTVPGQTPVVSNQGLLALNSNIGTYEQSIFSASPEIALNVTYRLSPCLALTAGYSFIHWSHVSQPGDQIDMALNTTQITGPLSGEPRPAFQNLDSNYYLHGLNLGLSWIW